MIEEGLACLRCYGDETFATHAQLWKHLIGCFKRYKPDLAQTPLPPPDPAVFELFEQNGLHVDLDVRSCWVCGTRSKHNTQLGKEFLYWDTSWASSA